MNRNFSSEKIGATLLLFDIKHNRHRSVAKERYHVTGTLGRGM